MCRKILFSLLLSNYSYAQSLNMYDVPGDKERVVIEIVCNNKKNQLLLLKRELGTRYEDVGRWFDEIIKRNCEVNNVK